MRAGVGEAVGGGAGLDDVAAEGEAVHTDGGSYGCPAAFGTAVVVALSYPGRPDVDLWSETSGCRSVSNGHICVAFATLPT